MNVPYSVSSLSPGEAGIRQTVRMMIAMVNRSFLNPMIRERAAAMIRYCNRNKACENAALLSFVNRKIQYVRDPSGVEALHDPVTFYETRLRKGLPVFGDCDDMSTYLAALLKSVGHTPEFRVISRNGQFYHHVHVVSDGMLLDPTLQLGMVPRQSVKALQFPI